MAKLCERMHGCHGVTVTSTDLHHQAVAFLPLGCCASGCVRPFSAAFQPAPCYFDTDLRCCCSGVLDAERNLAGRDLQPLGPAGPEPQQQHRVRATAHPICPVTQLWPHSPTGCKAQVWRTQFSRATFEVNSSVDRMTFLFLTSNMRLLVSM